MVLYDLLYSHYSEMLETGIDIKMVRKYLGDDVADHMKVFCIEHGLI